MPSHTESIRAISDEFVLLLRPNSGARMDLAKADVATTAGAIRALIRRGVTTQAGLVAYLAKWNSPYGADVVDFLLNAYNGTHVFDSLWYRDELGRFHVSARN